MAALEGQASQLGQQASQECDRLAKDRNLTLQILHKVTLQSISYLAQQPLYNLHIYRDDIVGYYYVFCHWTGDSYVTTLKNNSFESLSLSGLV